MVLLLFICHYSGLFWCGTNVQRLKQGGKHTVGMDLNFLGFFCRFVLFLGTVFFFFALLHFFWNDIHFTVNWFNGALGWLDLGNFGLPETGLNIRELRTIILQLLEISFPISGWYSRAGVTQKWHPNTIFWWERGFDRRVVFQGRVLNEL